MPVLPLVLKWIWCAGNLNGNLDFVKNPILGMGTSASNEWTFGESIVFRYLNQFE